MSDSYDSGPSSSSDSGSSWSTPDPAPSHRSPAYDPPSRQDPAPSFASALEDTYSRTTPESGPSRHAAVPSPSDGPFRPDSLNALDREAVARQDLPTPSAEPTVREYSSQMEEWLDDGEEDPDTDAGFLAWLDTTSSRSSTVDSPSPTGRLPRLAARHAKEPKALRAATADGGWVAVVPDSAGRVVATRHSPDGRGVRLDSVRDLLSLEVAVLEPWVPLPASGWFGDLEAERDSWPLGVPEEVTDLILFHATRARALTRVVEDVEARTERLVTEVERVDSRAHALHTRADAAERDLDHARAARVDAERRLRISLASSAVLAGLLVALVLAWILTA